MIFNWNKTNEQYQKVHTKACERCGKVFVPFNGVQRFCSEECRRAEDLERNRVKRREYSREYYRRLRNMDPKDYSRSTMKEDGTYDPVKCAICGKEFMPSSYNMKYCSDECRDVAHGKYRAAAYAKRKEKLVAARAAHTDTKTTHLLPDGTWSERECAACGKMFKPTSNNNKYCSEECAKVKQRKAAMNWRIKKREEKEKKMYQLNSSNTTPFGSSSYKLGDTPTFKKVVTTVKKKPQYTPEEYNRKLRNKTRRMIDTLRQLDKAKLDEKIIFEAINNINRMPLNAFDDDNA